MQQGYDPSLFTEQWFRENLSCSWCHKVPRNCVELNCDTEEHASDDVIYCESCLVAYLKQHDGMCPLSSPLPLSSSLPFQAESCEEEKKHSAPAPHQCRYDANKFVRRKLRCAKVRCPYSSVTEQVPMHGGDSGNDGDGDDGADGAGSEDDEGHRQLVITGIGAPKKRRRRREKQEGCCTWNGVLKVLPSLSFLHVVIQLN